MLGTEITTWQVAQPDQYKQVRIHKRVVCLRCPGTVILGDSILQTFGRALNAPDSDLFRAHGWAQQLLQIDPDSMHDLQPSCIERTVWCTGSATSLIGCQLPQHEKYYHSICFSTSESHRVPGFLACPSREPLTIPLSKALGTLHVAQHSDALLHRISRNLSQGRSGTLSR